MVNWNPNYKPIGRSKLWIEAAWEHIQSVPYKVSLRWVFYRLYQDGWFDNKKKDARKVKDTLADCRRNFYKGWTPDTLADDTRRVIRHRGHESPQAWADYMSQGFVCELDHWFHQTEYSELWYEARAMSEQFVWATEGIPITLRAMGGDASLDYKAQIAKDLPLVAERYGLPIRILYFGDYDIRGHQIPEAVNFAVRRWCETPWEMERVGLNAGAGDLYGLRDTHDGTFQWEALTHEQGVALIREAVEEWVDLEIVEQARKDAKPVQDAYNALVASFGSDHAATLRRRTQG